MSLALGHFRMIIMSGQMKPSPSVSQVLGPLGINTMNFLKEFAARTSTVRADVPLQVTVVPMSDKSYKFSVRTPQSQWFLMRASRVHTASTNGSLTTVGNITLKEIYEIAKIKSIDPAFIGVPLRNICVSLIGTARAMGLRVSKELGLDFQGRDDMRIVDLAKNRKELRALNKTGKKAGKK
jgi:large subunit ribosomal protein L11